MIARFASYEKPYSSLNIIAVDFDAPLPKRGKFSRRSSCFKKNSTSLFMYIRDLETAILN